MHLVGLSWGIVLAWLAHLTGIALGFQSAGYGERKKRDQRPVRWNVQDGGEFCVYAQSESPRGMKMTHSVEGLRRASERNRAELTARAEP